MSAPDGRVQKGGHQRLCFGYDHDYEKKQIWGLHVLQVVNGGLVL